MTLHSESDRSDVDRGQPSYDVYTASIDPEAFAHGAVGRRIDPSWGGPIELFLVPASAPRLV